MPSVLIEVRKPYSEAEEIALLEAVHSALRLREIAKENWGIRGGQAGCDVELGFKVEV